MPTYTFNCSGWNVRKKSGLYFRCYSAVVVNFRFETGLLNNWQLHTQTKQNAICKEFWLRFNGHWIENWFLACFAIKNSINMRKDGSSRQTFHTKYEYLAPFIDRKRDVCECFFHSQEALMRSHRILLAYAAYLFCCSMLHCIMWNHVNCLDTPVLCSVCINERRFCIQKCKIVYVYLEYSLNAIPANRPCLAVRRLWRLHCSLPLHAYYS